MNQHTYSKNLDKLIEEAHNELNKISITGTHLPQNGMKLVSLYKEFSEDLKELVTIYNNENGIK